MTLDESKNEFEKLLNCKSLGFYNCVEKTTIFLINKKSGSTDNYFTIFVFDERLNPTYTTTNLTPKLIPVSDSVSIGIVREVMTIDTATKCFDVLCENIISSTVNIGQGQLSKSICELVPKVFVPKSSTKEPQLNKVLKNNFFNGSYIVEFFDVEKNCLSSLNANQIKKANEAVYNIVPIDLFTVSDRIGNFIFQFPSINLKHHYKRNHNGKLDFSIHTDSRLSPNIDYQLICESIYDGNIIGYGTEQVLSVDNSIEIALGDISQIINTSIIDLNANLILSRQSTSFINGINLSFSIGAHFGQQREIYDENQSVIAAIDLVSKEDIELPKSRPEKYMSIVERRRYGKRTEDLLNRLEFKQYGKINNDKQAVTDIIEIMKKASSGKVYLWDPYLCAEDILKTWYYTNVHGLCLHAITSTDSIKLGEDRFPEWIKKQKKVFETRSNNYGINLEFRCQHGNYGYGFHDRFIMIQNEKEKPRVWSLGTSFNSLGNSHHIIQEVRHPQMIVDAFEELWESLSDESCLIWRNK